jgi:nitrogen fixation protein NifQ
MEGIFPSFREAAMHSVQVDLHRLLLKAAGQAPDEATVAFAGVISGVDLRPADYAMPIAGLGVEEFAWLLESEFPYLDWESHLSLRARQRGAARASFAEDEFADLFALLWDHRVEDDTRTMWLASAVATACMAANHLWQDMGLPRREMLNSLLAAYFPTLHAKNDQDMKWKKFFYKELCDRAEVHACRAPSCKVCNDRPACFGPEDGLPRSWNAAPTPASAHV